MKHTVLKQYWGYDTFRPVQENIIDSVLAGRDTLGLLPTGGGKSITFQVPALILPGLTLVVTPLISLMKDQVDNLRACGITAAMFHSGLTLREKELAMTRCRIGKAKIAYLSPERLQNRNFLAELNTLNVSLIVVDEAHCISQWGHDFRPSYLRIADLRRNVGPDVPVLALTASATPQVRADILSSLQMRNPAVFEKSFRRDNLSYIVRYDDIKERTLLNILHNTTGCAIVYVRSRRRTSELAQILAAQGIPALAYHAGLAPEEKDHRQNLWKTDAVRVMVATNAFGMGIDKPDVRVVVHFDLPSSLEEYYQEAGRAGRDGKHSFAVAIVAKSDKGLLTRRLNDSFPDPEFISHVYEMAGNFMNIAVGDGYGHTYEFDFARFCSTYSLPPVPAQSALRLLTSAGYLEYVADPASSARLMVIMPRQELYSLDLDPVSEQVLQTILRKYTGLFADYVNISETVIARLVNITSQKVYDTLLYLGRLHVIHYIPRRVLPYVYMTTSREEPRYLQLPPAVYAMQRQRMDTRLQAVKNFAFGTATCRQSTLLQYFGETDPAPCGRCDVCRGAAAPAATDESIIQSILHQASRHGGATLQDILRDTPAPSAKTISLLRTLLDNGRLTNTDGLITTP